MSDSLETRTRVYPWQDPDFPDWVKSVFRGVGQVFFQENALTGVCFVLGIAFSSPLMAAGALIGSAIGTITARLLNFDRTELLAGIYGFNSTLVGIAAFVFFRPGAATIALMVVGCIVAALVTRLMRRYLPFPTYTTPFIVTTWAVYFLGLAVGIGTTEPGDPVTSTGFVVATAHGIGQVMFQASVWTGCLFLIGIALNDWRHALWVLTGAVVGTIVANYHASLSTNALEPWRLVERAMSEKIAFGIYGYNATLTAVALFLWRRSLIAPLLGILISVPVTETFPALGLPALTAPFVLSTWIVLALGWLETRLFESRTSASV